LLIVTFLLYKIALPSAQGIQESTVKYIENMNSINFTGVKVGFFILWYQKKVMLTFFYDFFFESIYFINIKLQFVQVN